MDKIEELKKLLWILDSKHNVSVSQTKENIDFIADEIVKLFYQPAVIKSLPDSDEIRMKARELDEKDFAQWMWELQKGNVL